MAAPSTLPFPATLSRRSPARTTPLRWETTYRRVIRFADIVTIAACMWFGLFILSGSFTPSYRGGGLAVITGAVLAATQLARRSSEIRILGQGADEYRRLASAVAWAIVALGLAGLAAQLPDLRPWVFAVLPMAGAAMTLERFALRKVLHARRARSACMVPVMAAGGAHEVADLIARTRRESYNGWSVEAVCVPTPADASRPSEISGVPVVGGLENVAELAEHGGYRVVVAVPHPWWTGARLRDMAWELENTTADLVVAPALMEISGPRLRLAPVYGLTLLRLSKPSFSGGRWLLKATIDRVGAVIMLLVLAPLLLAIGTAIKLEDRGPVFFRQERVGRGGSTFAILKFRSMVVDAESRLRDLAALNEAAGPLFKLRMDPRVTRVGAILRRYSLDELPQLVNVAKGHMSLVGPRPPLPREVASYAHDARRRLLVKPGLTGLWQVSGRSDLSWEEAVRLDLRYVENWSLVLDIMIAWKTVSAVFHRTGAY